MKRKKKFSLGEKESSSRITRRVEKFSQLILIIMILGLIILGIANLIRP